MTDSDGGGNTGQGRRPVIIRVGSWLVRQILLQDGGLLATLRGLVAAALLAVTAKFVQRGGFHGTSRAQLLFGLAALGVAVALVVGALAYQRARREQLAPPADADQASGPSVEEPSAVDTATLERESARECTQKEDVSAADASGSPRRVATQSVPMGRADAVLEIHIHIKMSTSTDDDPAN